MNLSNYEKDKVIIDLIKKNGGKKWLILLVNALNKIGSSTAKQIILNNP